MKAVCREVNSELVSTNFLTKGLCFARMLLVGKNILFLYVKMKPGFVLLLLPFCSKDKIVFLEWLKGAKSVNKIILFHFMPECV